MTAHSCSITMLPWRGSRRIWQLPRGWARYVSLVCLIFYFYFFFLSLILSYPCFSVGGLLYYSFLTSLVGWFADVTLVFPAAGGFLCRTTGLLLPCCIRMAGQGSCLALVSRFCMSAHWLLFNRCIVLRDAPLSISISIYILILSPVYPPTHILLSGCTYFLSSRTYLLPFLDGSVPTVGI